MVYLHFSSCGVVGGTDALQEAVLQALWNKPWAVGCSYLYVSQPPTVVQHSEWHGPGSQKKYSAAH